MWLAGLVTGAGVGLGVVLILRGLAGGPPPLAQALLEHPAPTPARRPRPAAAGRGMRAARWLQARLASLGLAGRARGADLAVVGKSTDRLAVEKLAAGVTGLGLPVGFAVLVGAGGGVALPVPAVALASSGLAVGGFVLPDLLLAGEAAEARRGIRYALSSYLDLVTILLAAGAGAETALVEAAATGRGPHVERLQLALHRAQLAGEHPWAAFARLGRELDVGELRELAASLELAGTHGARVRASLEARAQSLRARGQAEAEARAEATTERMALPTTVLVMGFLAFVGFPAAHTILTF